MRLNSLLQAAQWVEQDINAIFGISNIPKSPIVNNRITRQGDLTLNNINVANSNVGMINIGRIQAESINVAISELEKNNQDEIANALKLLTEAILNSNDINSKDREILLENISFISEEALKPKEYRKKSLIINALEKIGGFAFIAENIKNIWEFSHPILHNFFS